MFDPSERANHIATLKSFGAQVKGNIVTLYRGADVPVEILKQLRYGDFLSATDADEDASGNAGAASYGANCVRFELPSEDVIVTGAGEYQYKGASFSLHNGSKYPVEIYRAFNDAYGANYTSQEIDEQDNVRAVASQALAAGRDEYDARLAGHQSNAAAIPKTEELKKASRKSVRGPR